MAYFNIKYLEKQKIDYIHFMYLQLVHQNKYEDHSELLERYDNHSYLEHFGSLGLLKFNKTPESASTYKRVRLSSKGQDIYRTCQIADVQPEDLMLFEYLEKEWDILEKPTGNKLAAKRYLAQFFAETGYNRRQVYHVIVDDYLPTMMSTANDYGKYIPTLEHFIWKATNAYKILFVWQNP